MNQEYFTVELASTINLGVPLDNMGAVAQFDVQSVCIVPGIAEFWHGVVNYKGSLLWVLDIDRFFDLEIQSDKSPQKMTAVVLKGEESINPKKVAIVTQQLKGILTIEQSFLKPIANNVSPQLRECCFAIAQVESQTTYIIDSTALLQQLHQKSMLLSA